MEKWIDKFLKVAIEQGTLEEGNKDVVRYGLIIAGHVLASTIAILLVGIVLDILPVMVVAAATGSLFRFVSGGAHFNSASLCLAFTALVYGTLSSVASTLGEVVCCRVPSCYLIGAGGVGLILVFGLKIVDAYVPVDSPGRPIMSTQEKQRFRMLSFLALFLIVFAYIGLTYFLQAWDLAFGVLFACCLQLFSLTPAGGRFIHKVEQHITRLLRRKEG